MALDTVLTGAATSFLITAAAWLRASPWPSALTAEEAAVEVSAEEAAKEADKEAAKVTPESGEEEAEAEAKEELGKEADVEKGAVLDKMMVGHNVKYRQPQQLEPDAMMT